MRWWVPHFVVILSSENGVSRMPLARTWPRPCCTATPATPRPWPISPGASTKPPSALSPGRWRAGKTVAVRAALADLDSSRHTVIYFGNPANRVVWSLHHHRVPLGPGAPVPPLLAGAPGPTGPGRRGGRTRPACRRGGRRSPPLGPRPAGGGTEIVDLMPRLGLCRRGRARARLRVVSGGAGVALGIIPVGRGSFLSRSKVLQRREPSHKESVMAGCHRPARTVCGRL